MSPGSPPEHQADSATGAGDSFRLSVRTSLLSEYRDSSGVLGAFELSHQFTSLGALGTALARMPGIRFEAAATSLWSPRPSRFMFNERAFEISVPVADIRIAPTQPGAARQQTEELLRLVCGELLPKWQLRARSRFFRI